MRLKVRKRYPSCIDVVLCCQKCRKLVHQQMFPVEDYQHCDLNHIFCCECIEEEDLKSCPICDQPLEYKRKKSPFLV